MTQPALAFEIRKRGRHYPWPPQPISNLPTNQWGGIDPENVPTDLTPLPSITNITSILHKNLVGYGGEHAIRAGYQHGWPDDVEEAVTRYKWAANQHRDARADAGTRAHTIAERLTNELPLPTDLGAEDEAYADAYRAFWRDYEPKPLLVEGTVMHPEAGYAGTGDLFANVNDLITVVDYKTRGVKADPKKAKKYGLLYDENKLQLAALAHAQYVASHIEPLGWLADDAFDVVQGMGVVLYPDGTYATETLTLAELESWFDCFLGVLRAWRVLKGVPQEVAA